MCYGKLSDQQSVEAYISPDGEKWSLDGEQGMFPCDLYASVADAQSPDGFSVTEAFIGSEHVNYQSALTGDLFDQAVTILVQNREWCTWAEQEAGCYDPRPAGGDPGSTHVDAGARI